MEHRYYDEYFELEDRHWWFVGRRRILISLLEERFGKGRSEGRRVLDVGCGTGVMLGYLADFGDVVGVDSSPKAVEYCRRRGFENVVLSDELPLPFEDGSFDLVTILDVLEHLADDAAMLREIERVLCPGGALLATVPAFPVLRGPHDAISHHERRYTRRGFSARLEEPGLEIERLTFFNTLLFPGIAAVKLARRLLPPSREPRSDLELTRPGRLDAALARALGSEARWLTGHDLPFGISLLAIASSGRRDVATRVS